MSEASKTPETREQQEARLDAMLVDKLVGPLHRQLAEALDRAQSAEARIAELEEAAKAAFDHVSELRDAWQRGCLSEHDGYGGRRSNRNVEVYVLLRKALASSGQGATESSS